MQSAGADTIHIPSTGNPNMDCIHISDFINIPLVLQRDYAVHYNLPSANQLSSDEICALLSGNTWIPALRHHLWVPRMDCQGITVSQDVDDLETWCANAIVLSVLDAQKFPYIVPPAVIYHLLLEQWMDAQRSIDRQQDETNALTEVRRQPQSGTGNVARPSRYAALAAMTPDQVHLSKARKELTSSRKYRKSGKRSIVLQGDVLGDIIRDTENSTNRWDQMHQDNQPLEPASSTASQVVVGHRVVEIRQAARHPAVSSSSQGVAKKWINRTQRKGSTAPTIMLVGPNSRPYDPNADVKNISSLVLASTSTTVGAVSPADAASCTRSHVEGDIEKFDQAPFSTGVVGYMIAEDADDNHGDTKPAGAISQARSSNASRQNIHRVRQLRLIARHAKEDSDAHMDVILEETEFCDVSGPSHFTEPELQCAGVGESDPFASWSIQQDVAADDLSEVATSPLSQEEGNLACVPRNRPLEKHGVLDVSEREGKPGAVSGFISGFKLMCSDASQVVAGGTHVVVSGIQTLFSVGRSKRKRARVEEDDIEGAVGADANDLPVTPKRKRPRLDSEQRPVRRSSEPVTPPGQLKPSPSARYGNASFTVKHNARTMSYASRRRRSSSSASLEADAMGQIQHFPVLEHRNVIERLAGAYREEELQNHSSQTLAEAGPSTPARRTRARTIAMSSSRRPLRRATKPPQVDQN